MTVEKLLNLRDDLAAVAKIILAVNPGRSFEASADFAINFFLTLNPKSPIKELQK